MNKWLAEMKNIDSSLRTLDKELSADAKLMASWGTNQGDDLSDVCQRMAQLMEAIYRKTIKSIKIQETTLDENRKKKHDLTGHVAKLQKSSHENPIKLMELQSTLDRVSAELLAQELELMQFKRQHIKDAFNAKFDAMIEYAEKMALIAGYGRQITTVIDTDTQVADRMRIYSGTEFTALTVSQVKTAITSWRAPQLDAPIRAHVAPSQDELALSAAAASAYNQTPPAAYNHARLSQPAVPAQHTSYPDQDREHEPAHYSNDDAAAPFPPPPVQSIYASDANHTSADEGHASDTAGASSTLHHQQLSHLQEQQRQLELEQQRLYQQNHASMSPGLSLAQQHYQSSGGSPQDTNGHGSMDGGYTPTPPRRSDTQEYHPPPPAQAQLGYDSGSNSGASAGYNGQYTLYGQYDYNTLQSTASPSNARPYPLGFVNPRDRDQMEADRHKAEMAGGGMLPPLNISQSPILHEK
ncbi:hypothetical protein BG004_007638 [Podila humilis]|nr:hypothetical protein BG004_007638 [Podila humilis]